MGAVGAVEAAVEVELEGWVAADAAIAAADPRPHAEDMAVVEGLPDRRATLAHKPLRDQVRAGAVVLACGSFESNPEMRARYLGPGWELAKIRGTRFNMGAGINMALAAGAADYVMPDLERIGGVTGWLRAAALAATHRIEMSSHLFPEVSAHLLAATPTAHFLEYMDWADKMLAEPLKIVDGCAVVPQRPGNGLTWDAKAVKKYRIA